MTPGALADGYAQLQASPAHAPRETGLAIARTRIGRWQSWKRSNDFLNSC